MVNNCELKLISNFLVHKVAILDMNRSMVFARTLTSVQPISTIVKRALEKRILFAMIPKDHSIVLVFLDESWMEMETAGQGTTEN